jgi:uncharacterized Zn finger protein (UPF0148 family)
MTIEILCHFCHSPLVIDNDRFFCPGCQRKGSMNNLDFKNIDIKSADDEKEDD